MKYQITCIVSTNSMPLNVFKYMNFFSVIACQYKIQILNKNTDLLSLVHNFILAEDTGNRFNRYEFESANSSYRRLSFGINSDTILGLVIVEVSYFLIENMLPKI